MREALDRPAGIAARSIGSTTRNHLQPPRNQNPQIRRTIGGDPSLSSASALDI
jgi:hypothetical protein